MRPMLGKNESASPNGRKRKMVTILIVMALVVVFGAATYKRQRGGVTGVDRVARKERVGQKNFGYRPNIIHIFMDDVGLNDLGFEGAPYKTPMIDKLAKYGMVLDGHRVFPSCTPTRMAFLTGRLPYEFGVTHAGLMTQYELPPELVLPEVLETAGYRNFGFGKWHSGRASYWAQPTTRGFESWTGFTPGFMTQSNLVNEIPWAFFTLAGFTTTDFDAFKKIEPAFGLYSWEEDGGISREHVNNQTWGDDLATDDVLDTLDDHCDVAHGQPCFIYLNFGAPHAPIEQPPTTKREKKRCQHITRAKRRMYCEMVQKIDSNIQRVVSKLKRTKKWKDTMIVLSSDNGGLPDIAAGNEPYLWDGYGSNLPYRGTKVSVFEGGIKTMAVVTGGYTQRQFCQFTLGGSEAACSQRRKLKKKLKKYWNKKGPIRRKGMMSVQDWYTTYASIAGVKSHLIPQMVDGKDQTMMLFGNMPSARTEYSAIGGRNKLGEITTGVLIQGNMKMVWNPATSKFVMKAAKMGWRPGATLDGFWDVDKDPTVRTPGDGEGNPVMLFDLAKDPTETKNVLNDPKYAGKRATLADRMHELQQIYTADPFKPQPAAIYASVKEGYVVIPWEDDPRYNTYNGTMREAVLFWLKNKQSPAGQKVVGAIEKNDHELYGGSHAFPVDEDDVIWP